MIFSTYWFVLFAILFFVPYWCIPSAWFRRYFLLVACGVFHTHFAGAAGVIPIVMIGAVTYAAARWGNQLMRQLAIVVCILGLAFYKYTGFLLANLETLVGSDLTWLQGASGFTSSIVAPLAISFFTFEFVHYLVDVIKGKPPIRRVSDFVAFAIFFPSLVAGPIKRYEDFLPSLEYAIRRIRASDVSVGLMQVAFGYLKKVIADNLTLFIDQYEGRYFGEPLEMRWVIALAISFRILFDFSGYSDMAIGLARMMGIRLMANFNWPYLATSVQDFWRRWHISLSTWIRDYIYIPMGGSRHGTMRRLLNALVAFGLCGLWHGPAWNFVVWGLYHGLGLCLNATYHKIPFLGPFLQQIFRWVPPISWVLTMLFVLVGWLIFFYPVPLAFEMTQALFYVD